MATLELRGVGFIGGAVLVSRTLGCSARKGSRLVLKPAGGGGSHVMTIPRGFVRRVGRRIRTRGGLGVGSKGT